eukprot:6754096-Alexandrium_andersonii.AAC.1
MGHVERQAVSRERRLRGKLGRQIQPSDREGNRRRQNQQNSLSHDLGKGQTSTAGMPSKSYRLQQLLASVPLRIAQLRVLGRHVDATACHIESNSPPIKRANSVLQGHPHAARLVANAPKRRRALPERLRQLVQNSRSHVRGICYVLMFPGNFVDPFKRGPRRVEEAPVL